jgi:hypothetical protein
MELRGISNYPRRGLGVFFLRILDKELDDGLTFGREGELTMATFLPN